MKVQLNNKDNIFILLRIVISLGTAHLEWKKKSSRLVDMLGTVIMRKKRTAVCSRFQSQFRPLTSEIGKAEQCPAMRKDHPVSDFKKKSTQSPCCLQRAISMVWIVKIIQPSSSKKKSKAAHITTAWLGRETKARDWSGKGRRKTTCWEDAEIHIPVAWHRKEERVPNASMDVHPSTCSTTQAKGKQPAGEKQSRKRWKVT